MLREVIRLALVCWNAGFDEVIGCVLGPTAVAAHVVLRKAKSHKVGDVTINALPHLSVASHERHRRQNHILVSLACDGQAVRQHLGGLELEPVESFDFEQLIRPHLRGGEGPAAAAAALVAHLRKMLQ